MKKQCRPSLTQRYNIRRGSWDLLTNFFVLLECDSLKSQTVESSQFVLLIVIRFFTFLWSWLNFLGWMRSHLLILMNIWSWIWLYLLNVIEKFDVEFCTISLSITWASEKCCTGRPREMWQRTVKKEKNISNWRHGEGRSCWQKTKMITGGVLKASFSTRRGGKDDNNYVKCNYEQYLYQGLLCNC